MMKIRKIILGSAALIAGAALGAQNLNFHGYMDYTNFAVGQEINKLSKDGEWDVSEASAEYGSFYNGRTELNVTGGVGPVSFATGVRLDSSLGEWYNLYRDVSASGLNETMFHQANIRVSMLQDQLVLHAGKFEEWNCGFILNGYQMGGQPISDLAMRDYGQHMTGLEWIPNMSIANGALVGLRMYAGLPLLPPGQEYDWTEANKWENLWKKTKIMAAYKWLRYNLLFTAGFHNEYYAGTNNSWAYENNYNDIFYSEAFLQADLPTLVSGVKLNVSYDLRWRKAEYEVQDVSGGIADWSEPVFAHYVGISGRTEVIPAWPITFENRFFYADDHYLSINEKALMDAVAVGVSHAIPGTSYKIGLNAVGKYAQDANGTSFGTTDGYAPTDSAHAGGLMDFHTDWMDGPNVTTTGAATRYIGVYASPYFQKDFSNGFFQIALEVQYMNVSNDNVEANGINYRVPFKFCFWF
ncbi:hypothetical protein [uncultured Treponema sp.]|uniref:hypothetical protein n=1 Tax=uncultured Treponema sp. TaxID=162155 RepID=UPI002585BB1B|nr:hypothetical protein [uncultured Treponema sp.]